MNKQEEEMKEEIDTLKKQVANFLKTKTD